MSPAPIDSQMALVPVGTPSGLVGTPSMAGTIPLSTLIDFIIQRTYHELNVLSEL